MPRLVVLLTLSLMLAVPAVACASARAAPRAAVPAAAASWRRPVDAPVTGPFTYSPARRFARGRRRGVDFAAARGAPVRAPCAGRVSYAGALPARGLGVRVSYAGAVPARELGVTLRCGRLTATLLGLEPIAVRRGARIAHGQAVGRASGRVPVRLGARLTGRRFAYVDPLRLLGREPPRARPPLGTVPRGPRGVARRPPLLGRPAVPVTARMARGRAADGARAQVPAVAWVGAALVAVALTAGIGLPRVRGRGTRRATATSTRP